MAGVANGAEGDAAAVLFDGREIARVQALPGFEAAVRRAVGCWIPGEADTDTALLRDLGRFVAATWTFYLDAEPGGLTRSRLEALLAATGVSGVGRAQSMLLYLRFIRYIEPAPDPDNRVRRFAPTAALTKAFGERMRRELSWAATLDEDVAAMLARFDDPAVRRTFLRCHGEHSVAAFRAYQAPAISLDVFSHRNSGMVILACLLQVADSGGAFPPVGLVRFSVSRLAARADTPRSRVRKQLQAAEAVGFLADLGEGEARLTPLLAQHVRDFVAGAVLLFAWDARGVLAETGLDSGEAVR